MANRIDVNKLKKDAFNAIDELFREDNEQFEVEESPIQEAPIEDPPQKTELMVSPIDDFAILDEFILALDWEYSEDEIQTFIEHLKNIEANNPDPYSQTLIKMLNSIITYLVEAKNKAFPDTFNVLSAVVAVLKKINSPEFDTTLAKSEVSKVYQSVKDLKQNILKYNSKLKKNLGIGKDVMPGANRGKERPAPESTVSAPDNQTFKSNDSLEDTDIFAKRAEEIKSSPNTFKSVNFEKIEAKMADRLDQCEQRLAFLEEQNQILRQIITAQNKNSQRLQAQEPNTDFASPPQPKDFKVDDFSAELEAFAPLDTPEPKIVDVNDLLFDETEAFPPLDTSEPESIDVMKSPLPDEPAAFSPLDIPEPETVDVNDILFDELEGEEKESADPLASTMEETKLTEDSTSPETVGTQMFYEKEASEPDEKSLNGLSGEREQKDTESEESNEYVRLFKLDQEDIAIPAEYFNNLYKLPNKIKNQIHSIESIQLGELSSFFHKLSKNMKGSLQDVPEKELKKISAEVKLLINDKIDYQYAVLCSCDDRYIIVPVSDKHKTSTMVVGQKNSAENSLSQFSIEVDDGLIIPLIIPC